ncbi:apolipoprotein N-acyltransferase [Halanaerobacter jeridensis]|uniref:Apolipoprotein N-acyltransferase n=1 Tax=Halanaerobacter jeridensis TaxID=706427 RepID=A0A938XWM3_9FIRM|nr:apolipoprotein N-acyltransferase [Halanaerobacter jeridensis]MBM7556635.1 apolipoprotein N-acyltransferase [Halanaerobacter jeridensis]
MSYYLIILSGLMLGLPFVIPQFALLAWIGLIPMLKGLENRSWQQSLKLGWLFGITFLTISSNWLMEPIIKFSGYPLIVSALIFFICAAILALYFALFAVILNFLQKQFNVALLILVPIVWTGVEFLRSIYSFQFLFAFLGYTQSFIPEMIQFAQVGGVYLVTFIIVLVNTIFYVAWQTDKQKTSMIYGLIAILIIGGVFAYGRWELNQISSTKTNFRVGIVQPNIPQHKKLDSDYYSQLEKKLVRLSETEIQKNKPDLLVWPETAILRSYNLDRKFPYLKDYRTPLYVGGFVRQGNGPLNSALLVNDQGEIVNRYSKNILVPWGEYVPFPNIVPDFIETNLNHITPGKEKTEFNLKNVSWIGAICSEILNPDYIRDAYNQNDFIINISNEAWFGDSSAPRQVLQAAIFRAVEHQVPVVKIGNTGISGLISPQGKILKKTELLTTETLTVKVELPKREETIYYLIGDIIGRGSLIAIILLLLIAAYQRYNSKE